MRSVLAAVASHRAAAAAVLTGVVALAACIGSEFRGDLELKRSLERAIAAGGEHRPVRIAQATRFRWERMYVFGPYTSSRGIDAALGFHWDAPELLLQDQDANLWLFVAGRKVVRAALNVRVASLLCLFRQQDYTPASAVFFVTRGRGSASARSVKFLLPVRERTRRCLQ